MNRLARTACLLALFSILSVGLSLGRAAAGAGTETVTIQLDFTTPNGVQVTGTIVAERQMGTATLTEATFNGMVNGQPASATATGGEKWSGNTVAEFDLTSFTQWNVGLDRPGPMKIVVAQAAPGLVTINGIPMAIDGNLAAPGMGRTSYKVTNPGQSTGEIVFLPKTGDGSVLASPLLIVTLMIGPGIVLVLLSGLLRRLGKRETAGADLEV